MAMQDYLVHAAYKQGTKSTGTERAQEDMIWDRHELGLPNGIFLVS
jgi:hypothetical protein